MESLVNFFTSTLGQYISAEAVVFIISMIPILELRGGLLAASLLNIPLGVALPVCIVGNIIPVPFILLFINKIFSLMRRWKTTAKVADFFEEKAMKRSDNIRKYEFLGLLLFVGIPLPGTGAWTGSLISSLLKVDIKKAVPAVALGVLLAAAIMTVISYGVLGSIIR